MDEATRTKTAGFDTLQADLVTLIRAVIDFTQAATR
jgi:hypothetical protein